MCTQFAFERPACLLSDKSNHKKIVPSESSWTTNKAVFYF